MKIRTVQIRRQNKAYPIEDRELKTNNIRVGCPKNPCAYCDSRGYGRMRIVFDSGTNQEVVNVCVGCILRFWTDQTINPLYGGKVREHSSYDVIKCNECGDSARGGIWFCNARVRPKEHKEFIVARCMDCILKDISLSI